MALYTQGYSLVAGLDEAGRGCLAGPVVAAAVILPLAEDTTETLARFAGVNDSKQLTFAARERLYDIVMEHAISVGIGVGSVELIDQRNILQATKYAMRQALDQLTPEPEALLLDALTLPNLPQPQRSIIKGDARCLSIAAASIIAKVTRDRFMIALHNDYPHYGFDQHKGYGTAAHIAALSTHGVTDHHRKTFAPVSELLYGLFTQDENEEDATDRSRGEPSLEQG
ncbi:MAG TPA: ribonuclease HII [Ktedonobacteraceae bacterium]|nr:ribonuclease HII [Ktedonobacteraceae bacterium]